MKRPSADRHTQRPSGPGPVRPALFVWLAVLLAGPAVPASAQRYLVETYTGQDGLPNSNVRDLHQGPDGSLWFATHAGVARYDGLTWTVYSEPRLPSRSASFVAVDPGGTVWIATPESPPRLVVGTGDSWQSFSYDLPLTGSRGGPTAFALAAAADRSVAVIGTEHDGALVLDGSGWRRLPPGSGLDSGEVLDLLALGEGAVLVVAARGVARLELGRPDRVRWLNLPSEAGAALAAARAGDGATWVLTERALIELSQSSVPTVHPLADLDLAPDDSPRLAVDPGFAAYVGWSRGLWRVPLAPDQGPALRLGPDNGLASGTATALLIDREGTLWVASIRGVSKVASFRFPSYSRADGMFEDEVTAICEPEPGVLLFGHNGGGLSLLEGNEFRTYELPGGEACGRDRCRVMDLHVTASGETWVAAAGLGLARWRRAGVGRWHRPDGPSDLSITSVLSDSSGRLWVGGDRGLWRFHHGAFDPVGPTGAEAPAVRRLTLASDGSVLAATPARGLLRLEGNDLRPVAADGPVVPGVYTAFADSSGRDWVGTGSGLLRLVDRRLRRPAEAELTFGRPVFQISEDGTGAIWFGTDDGVRRWDGRRLETYTTREGFVGRETNRSATLLDSRRRLWLGADLGVSRVEASAGRRTPPAPLVALISAASADGPLPLSAVGPIVSSSGSVRFEYRVVSLVAERALTLQIRLEGLDAEWSDDLPWYQRHTHYRELAPGRYRFHVRARSALGDEWAEAASPWIRVRGPLWARWWFVLLAALGGVAVAAVVAATVAGWRYAAKLGREVEARTRALSESEARYRSLFDEASLGYLVISRTTGELLDLNPMARRLFGLTAPDGDRPEWLDGLLAETGSAREAPSELVLELPAGAGGESQLIEVSGAEIELDGEPCLMIACRDVTDQRRIEEARQRAERLESLGLLAGGIAHDFNNYLTVVLGSLSLIRLDPDLPEQLAGPVDSSVQAIEQSRQLTAKLLTFAKGGAPVRRLTDMARVIRDAASLVLAGSRCSLETEIASALWSASVDEAQITQVLHNVLLNAVQAMPTGGTVRVSARNHRIEPPGRPGLVPGDYLRIAIRDRGAGIPPDHLARIFDPYFTTKAGGRGLGLATARSIAAAHRGLLELESVLGRGTSVTVWLPADPTASAPPPATLTSPTEGSGRVLVMDDDPAIRRLYTTALGRLGYDVVATEDGQSAVGLYRAALAEDRRFDVVILDLTVPGGLGGLETFALLRELDPAVRVVVASGYSTDAAVARHTELGFAGALQKPFTVTDLAQVLATLSDGGAERATDPPR